ncbi:FCN1 [Branchiostoma lanceolatum]|uniref:FCN1 protein n=1 Tax=Branchiostoma lanceolatum TaxID=7740 RepID=A0A8J9ZDX5_BRALA|nr:FCN1 [Branchiostoma lanceolatum]
MATARCVQLLCASLVIFCTGKTVAGAGDVIRWYTDCAAVKSGTWSYTFRTPAGFLAATHLQRPRATCEQLKQHLETAGGMLEQTKRILEPPEMKDCSAIFQWLNGKAISGVYNIRPAGANRTFPAYCRMAGGEGWTVLQRRQDGSVDFFRTWAEYKRGFGDPATEFWLGNDNIHLLTSQAEYKLRVDLETFDGKATYAQYRIFSIADEASAYKLTEAAGYSGTAGNAFLRLKGKPFVTRDRDTKTKIASKFRTAGWLYTSYSGNLNGVYHTPQTAPTKTTMILDAIRWSRRKTYGSKFRLLKFVEMRIAPNVT